MKNINLPDFFIIGAMKSATSTLHDQLDFHDTFFMSSPKETNFFSNTDVFEKGIHWYQSLFKDAKACQIRGESSTNYTKLPDYPETVKRISSICPEAKFVYVIRHPVDRLISQYIHEWTQKIISCDINTAILKHPMLINYSLYNMQIEPYIDTFGKDSVLLMFFERLISNPISEIDRLFRFLGVSESVKWDFEMKKNESSQRLKISLLRDSIVNNKIVTYIRRKYIPKKIRNSIKNLWTIKERPELSADSIDKIEEIFNKDLQCLSQKTGIELNCTNWKIVAQANENIKWI